MTDGSGGGFTDGGGGMLRTVPVNALTFSGTGFADSMQIPRYVYCNMDGVRIIGSNLSVVY